MVLMEFSVGYSTHALSASGMGIEKLYSPKFGFPNTVIRPHATFAIPDSPGRIEEKFLQGRVVVGIVAIVVVGIVAIVVVGIVAIAVVGIILSTLILFAYVQLGLNV
jgi:hypothetical protein